MAKEEVDEAMKELKAKLEEKAEPKRASQSDPSFKSDPDPASQSDPACQPKPDLADEDQRKLFVGGLAQDAKDTDIKEYFGQYGEIEHINLKHDPMTGRSRGFAFIVFKETSGLEAASAQEAHIIKDKRCTCKKAECRQGKIYVGKLPMDEQLSNEEVTAHFAQFGSVVEVIRPVDKMRGDAPKNFCFVTFDREEPARKLVKEGFTTIKGHQVVVGRVTPKDGSRGGFMGRGRGGGGFGMGYPSYPGSYGATFSPYGGPGGFVEPFAGAYAYGGGYGSPAPGFGGGYGASQGYYTAESAMGSYAGRPSPGKILRGVPMRGRGPRGRPY